MSALEEFEVVGDDQAESSTAGQNKPRTWLACLSCRARRNKCSGERPSCKACVKDDIPCEWPTGRKRKRTNKEMEEDRLKAREAKAAGVKPEQLEVSTVMPFLDPFSTSPDPFPPPWTTTQSAPEGTGLPGPSQFAHPLEPSVFTAFLRGEPGEDANLELYYYRFSGATAIQPGIHRIALKHQQHADLPVSFITPQSINRIVNDASPASVLMDVLDADGLPYPHVWGPLFELFLRHLSQYFPSLSRQRMTDRMESGTMSRFLANAICALAARHTENTLDPPVRLCTPFIVKAEELVTPLLQLPATETMTGLLLLSWAYYGTGSETGLGQYTGMAVRMATDIGIHEVHEFYDSPTHLRRARLLWWSLFVSDRIIAFLAGRSTAIADDLIEIPLPCDENLFPDPARDSDEAEPVEPVPFVYFVRLMVICGRICNILNGKRGRTLTIARVEPPSRQLSELQTDVVEFLKDLPESLKWTPDNFRHQHQRGHGGTYFALHLWAYALLILLNNQHILQPSSGIATPQNTYGTRGSSIAVTMGKQICECIAVAKVVSPSTYTSLPYVVQPMFIAGMALANEAKHLQAAEDTGVDTQFILSFTRQGINNVLDALSQIEPFYSGTSVVINILEKRSGIYRQNRQAAQRPIIPMPDSGLLRRFTIDPNHPKSLAQPTDTSYRDAKERSEQQPLDSTWLNELLKGYDLDSLTFSSSDVFNLERFLEQNEGS